MYNHLFLPHCGYSSRTAWKGHYMTPHSRRTPQHFSFSKTYLFSSIQIIHNILSCQIKKIYGGSLLGFFSTTEKKGYIETFKEYRQTVKNTGSNINTISAYTKWTLISNTILNTGKKSPIDVFEHRNSQECAFSYVLSSLYIFIYHKSLPDANFCSTWRLVYSKGKKRDIFITHHYIVIKEKPH